MYATFRHRLQWHIWAHCTCSFILFLFIQTFFNMWSFSIFVCKDIFLYKKYSLSHFSPQKYYCKNTVKTSLARAMLFIKFIRRNNLEENNLSYTCSVHFRYNPVIAWNEWYSQIKKKWVSEIPVNLSFIHQLTISSHPMMFCDISVCFLAAYRPPIRYIVCLSHLFLSNGKITFLSVWQGATSLLTRHSRWWLSTRKDDEYFLWAPNIYIYNYW